MPPSHVRRSSHRSRPDTPSHTARPLVNRSRVRPAQAARASRHAGVIWRWSRLAVTAPVRWYSCAGTYSRPRVQSTARSCQKLVSCSAEHTASDASSSSGSRHPPMRRTRRPTGLAERRQ